MINVSFKKKEQVVSMASKTPTSMAENWNAVQVDSALLFQRLVRVAELTPNVLAEAFSFELSNIPTALFDSSGLLRQANKAAVAQYLWSSTAQVNAELPDQVCFVIDGSSLLHRLPWPRGSSYNELIQMYIDYVIRVYKKGTVVFDGYSHGPSTKDVAHLRRSHGGNASRCVSFDGNMLLYNQKKDF